MSRYFTVLDEVTRRYRRFNVEGRELTVRMTAPLEASAAARDPAQHFANSLDKRFEYSLRDLDPSDMVGISIHNADIQQDRPVGLSFWRRDQISRESCVGCLRKLHNQMPDTWFRITSLSTSFG